MRVWRAINCTWTPPGATPKAASPWCAPTPQAPCSTLEQANALGQAVATQLRAGGAIGVAGAADSASAG